MSKTFTFAGTCTENGATVYKFANKASRAKELERFGCTNVSMVELPSAMSKEAAVEFLATKGITAERAVKAAKPATVKATKPAKATKPSVRTVIGTGAAASRAEDFINAWFTHLPAAQKEKAKADW
jgi:hypothetical protein